jgi:8-oxo-dGTP pyrophosphatase MutT (NUDIX family)
MTQQERERWGLRLAQTPPLTEFRPAAVLVPMVETPQGLSLLFELRSDTLTTSAGEVCFPGGGIEPGETPEQAALRELQEELAISSEGVQLLGALPELTHSSGRKVYPVVGMLAGETLAKIVPAPVEVAEWFTVPLEWFRSNPAEVCRYTLIPQGTEGQPESAQRFLQSHHLERQTPYWIWECTPIWGLTARIVAALLAAEATQPTQPPEEDTLWKLETNVDDCTGEALGFAMERLLAAGAKDAYYQPIYMKKNRPAYQLSVICTESKRVALEEILFLHTTTIGVRRIALERTALPRRKEVVETPLGRAEVKVVTLPDGSLRAYPEYESVAALSRATGKDYQSLYRLVQSCWRGD